MYPSKCGGPEGQGHGCVCVGPLTHRLSPASSLVTLSSSSINRKFKSEPRSWVPPVQKRKPDWCKKHPNYPETKPLTMLAAREASFWHITAEACLKLPIRGSKQEWFACFCSLKTSMAGAGTLSSADEQLREVLSVAQGHTAPGGAAGASPLRVSCSQ